MHAWSRAPNSELSAEQPVQLRQRLWRGGSPSESTEPRWATQSAGLGRAGWVRSNGTHCWRLLEGGPAFWREMKFAVSRLPGGHAEQLERCCRGSLFILTFCKKNAFNSLAAYVVGGGLGETWDQECLLGACIPAPGKTASPGQAFQGAGCLVHLLSYLQFSHQRWQDVYKNKCSSLWQLYKVIMNRRVLYLDSYFHSF